jgi:hypothetical protein
MRMLVPKFLAQDASVGWVFPVARLDRSDDPKYSHKEADVAHNVQPLLKGWHGDGQRLRHISSILMSCEYEFVLK